MAGYRFNKPWASESQNVQDFNEQEWGTGIVEKSLVSSAQVNGVMQAVTKRFLDLEAVEDRQYRFDFIVDDQESWNNFIAGNVGGARTVLIRNGEWVASTKVAINEVLMIAIEYGATVDFSRGVDRSADSFPLTIFGGIIAGGLTNCILANAALVVSYSTTYAETTLENSTIISLSTVTVTGGSYFNTIVDLNGGITGAKLVDCKIKKVKTLTNCTLTRCTIPNNTKLAYCTLIDCDYTVDNYTENLITDTTFRNCNLSFTTAGASTTAVCDSSNKAYGSRIEFHLSRSEHVSMIIYDSQIIFYRASVPAGPLCTDSQFFGTSFMNVSGAIDVDVVNAIKSLGAKGSIMTDVPFCRNGANFYVYNPSSIVYPGIINKIPNNDSRTLLSYARKQKFFLNFTGDTSNTLISYGRFKFIPWCRAAKSVIDDSYNIEFIAGAESAV